MSEKLLNRPKIRPAGEQMGREGMAQRMRRRVLGQPLAAAEITQGTLGNTWVEPSAAHTSE